MHWGSRTAAVIVALALAASVSTADDSVWAPDERAFSAFSEDKHRQFDFWIGEWDVNLRMLQGDLTFKDTIKARAHIYSILNGKAILELWDSGPIKGYSLRYFDSDSQKWVLWLNWPNPETSRTTSLSGEFRHGRGDFRSQFTTPDGQTIDQRYSFNDITPFSLRWDDLNSNDGGNTWRKNWRMEFTRTAVDPSWPDKEDEFLTYQNGARCSNEKFRPYESVVGQWQGQINGHDATLRSGKIVDGCAVIVFLDIDDEQETKRFIFLTYNTFVGRWEADYVDDDRDSGSIRLVSDSDWSSTAGNDHSLQWQVDENTLEYRFEYESGSIESGSFERK